MGRNVRDWIYVEDNCRAIRLVMEKGKKGQVYNIAGGEEKKNIDITRETLRRLSLPDTMIQFVKDRPGHDLRYSLDCRKMNGLIWKPQVTFEEGIQKTIDWYVVNKRWWRPLVAEMKSPVHIGSSKTSA
jgi:dTDP-glucose 4,6-dehydratase